MVGGASGCVMGGVSVAVEAAAEPEVLILQSWAPAVTFSPSGTNSSSITPDTGEGTGMAVWEGRGGRVGREGERERKREREREGERERERASEHKAYKLCMCIIPTNLRACICKFDRKNYNCDTRACLKQSLTVYHLLTSSVHYMLQYKSSIISKIISHGKYGAGRG